MTQKQVTKILKKFENYFDPEKECLKSLGWKILKKNSYAKAEKTLGIKYINGEEIYMRFTSWHCLTIETSNFIIATKADDFEKLLSFADSNETKIIMKMERINKLLKELKSI